VLSSFVVVRLGVKRPKKVPSSSWSPTMKGTLAYSPVLMRISGEAVRDFRLDGRGRRD
jgi:hypothetical protein